jgi:hypothetical protein
VNRAPALSVITVTPSGYAAVRRTVAHVRAQSVAEQIELIIVARPGAGIDPAHAGTGRPGRCA